MADLMTINAWQCTGHEGTTDIAGSNGEKHTVIIDRDYRHCTCKGFQFRKTCKHIQQVFSKACCWHQQHEEGEPIERNGKHYCPRCDAELESVRVGV